MLAGVPAAVSASDYLLVSRATREILSPFGVPLMYRQCAYVSPVLCLTALMSHKTLCLTGLMSHRPYVSRGAYVSRDGLMSHRNGRRIVPDACRCRTWNVGVRLPSRFSRDTKNPHPFWRSSDVRACLPRRHFGEETSRGDIPRGHPEETS